MGSDLSRNDSFPALEGARLSDRQRRVLAVVILAIILEGIDIQLLGLAAPAILQDWHLAKAALGAAMAGSLLGMTLGAPLGGVLGDRFGRRIILLAGVSLFGFFTVLTALAMDVAQIASLRVLAGFWFGAVLTNAPTLASEWMPQRLRKQVAAFVVVGTPIGGMLGSAGGAWLIPHLGWRIAFAVGGTLPLSVAAAMIALLPESPRFLAARSQHQSGLASLRQLLATPLRRSTYGIDLAFFANLAVNYAFFSWAPSLLVSVGLPMQASIRGLLYFNMFGALAAIIAARFFGRRRTHSFLIAAAGLGLAAALLLALLIRAAVTASTNSLPPVIAVCLALVGVATVASQALLFALATRVYPTECRASGLGVAGGAGRFGGLLSAYFGGHILSRPAGADVFLVAVGALFLISASGILIVARNARSSVVT
jgi:AAHS family 4-hydroxybenzoate transporter-like MFS transporter